MVDAPTALFVGAHVTLLSLVLVTPFVILPVVLQMLTYTGCILYIGSHHSLKMFDKDADTGEQQEIESVSKKDAMMFPVVGSIALFSMYCAYKFFGKYWVNLLLNGYLTMLGMVAVAETLVPVLHAFVPEGMRKTWKKLEFRIPVLMSEADDPVKLSISQAHAPAYLTAVVTAVAYLYTQHWTLHNVFGICFSLQAVALISLGRFPVAFILLSGLFFYDIFWVFGTDVMVSVATNFQGPIKIIFPVAFDPWKQSILGLGDIVIPGIFVAMTLRFDAQLHKKAQLPDGDVAALQNILVGPFTAFPKRHFWPVFVSYLAALLTTGIIMFGFNRAQPALLYLVPFTILTHLGASAACGKFREMLAYNEEELTPKKEEEGVQATVEGEDKKLFPGREGAEEDTKKDK